MRIVMASLISAFLVAGCGSSDMPAPPPDGESAVPDMSNAPPDLLSNSPDLEPTSCDVIKQDCTDPNKSKCTYVDDGTATNNYIPICVMPTGTKMTGDPCSRINGMASGVGYDDCAKGDFCTGAGTLSRPPMDHCRSWCTSDDECKSSETCLGAFANATKTAFLTGLCTPTCTAFGNDCAQGFNCSNLYVTVDAMDVRLACRQTGTVPNGGVCTSDLDCVADTICIVPKKGSPRICSQLCDMTSHPCSNGQQCFRYLMDVPGSMVFGCVTL
jgi:hypothetical protein